MTIKGVAIDQCQCPSQIPLGPLCALCGPLYPLSQCAVALDNHAFGNLCAAAFRFLEFTQAENWEFSPPAPHLVIYKMVIT